VFQPPKDADSCREHSLYLSKRSEFWHFHHSELIPFSFHAMDPTRNLVTNLLSKRCLILRFLFLQSFNQISVLHIDGQCSRPHHSASKTPTSNASDKLHTSLQRHSGSTRSTASSASGDVQAHKGGVPFVFKKGCIHSRTLCSLPPGEGRGDERPHLPSRQNSLAAASAEESLKQFPCGVVCG